MKTTLMVTTAVIALMAGHAMAGGNPGMRAKTMNLHPMHRQPAGVLYSQNSNFGSITTNSQNYTSGTSSAFNDAAADDFVVPAGVKWRITGLDVTGLYGDGDGPATSEVVTFYKDKGGHPGKIAGKGTDKFVLNCTDNSGSFSCSIPNNALGKPVTLKGGKTGKHYWVSIVANCSLRGGCGAWFWVQNSVTHNNPGKWQQPGDGSNTGCTKWTTTSTCFDSGFDDQAFDLIGTQK